MACLGCGMTWVNKLEYSAGGRTDVAPGQPRAGVGLQAEQQLAVGGTRCGFCASCNRTGKSVVPRSTFALH